MDSQKNPKSFLKSLANEIKIKKQKSVVSKHSDKKPQLSIKGVAKSGKPKKTKKLKLGFENRNFSQPQVKYTQSTKTQAISSILAKRELQKKLLKQKNAKNIFKLPDIRKFMKQLSKHQKLKRGQFFQRKGKQNGLKKENIPVQKIPYVDSRPRSKKHQIIQLDQKYDNVKRQPYSVNRNYLRKKFSGNQILNPNPNPEDSQLSTKISLTTLRQSSYKLTRKSQNAQQLNDFIIHVGYQKYKKRKYKKQHLKLQRRHQSNLRPLKKLKITKRHNSQTNAYHLRSTSVMRW